MFEVIATTALLPLAAARFTVVGETLRLGAVPDCFTVIVWAVAPDPETVIVPSVRSAALVLAVTALIVRAPPPLPPFAGVTVTNDELLDAAVQLIFALTVTDESLLFAAAGRVIVVLFTERDGRVHVG